MANKNRNLIIAYFPSVDEAKKAADNLRNWDKASDNIKLGGIGIITEDDDGKLKTQKVGARAAGTGAKWGTIVGAVAERSHKVRVAQPTTCLRFPSEQRQALLVYALR